MKSAYELAMERLGGTAQYSDEVKARLAEIDRRYDARKAEARIACDDRVRKTNGDAEKIDAARADLARELARLDEKREAEKESVRKAAKKG